jgi:hypothetical protein
MLKMLLLVFFLHWIADFIMQSRKVAENKGEDTLTLMKHVSIYSGTLFIGLVWFDSFFAFQISIVNGFCHFFIDAVTSQFTSHFYKEDKIHEFWITIGFDQYLHNFILILTVWFFYKGHIV